jgi:hypothetical protein
VGNHRVINANSKPCSRTIDLIITGKEASMLLNVWRYYAGPA